MKKPVMVIGGGIAGIQASTDLADMGVPVFLIERGPSIGGRMAQLDKTFPTNDCSACILAPKITSCFNHPLVKTMTLSDVVELKGDAPNLRAVVRRRPRYVDEDACKGCDDCVQACPVKVKNEFDLGMRDRSAIYKPFAQAVPNKVAIDKRGTSPCKFNCPAKLDAHGYVTLVGAGRYDEALDVVRRTTPFAGVLGRVCAHPCEDNCVRQYVEQPVSIASLKRFIADRELERGIAPSVAVSESVTAKDDMIAIAGAGPAGLNCAYQLALRGYKPVIFEAEEAAGGMLRLGIPDYRLDKGILAGEAAIIEKMGVEIRFGRKLGRDFTIETLKKEGYRAIFIAVGAYRDMKMGIPGEESAGVIPGVDFLRGINLGKRPAIGKKVAVVGGGNVAMDAARSSLRLGCDVTVVYRRTRAEMPASELELRHAEEEGVKIQELSSPKEVKTDSGGRVTGLLCERNALGGVDSSGRRIPVQIEGSDYVIEADCVIVAVGQRVDGESAAAGGLSKFSRAGNIEIDEAMNTGIEGVFAGGDATRGPASVIEAIADGNRAAIAISNYLENKNEAIDPFTLPQTPIELVETRRTPARARAEMPAISIDLRRTTFNEVETGYDETTAQAEALRCLGCSVCCECRMCEDACQAGAIRHNQLEDTVEIDVSSVILATGAEMNSAIPPEFGLGRFCDVVTNIEYERILSASGPFDGHVRRPSDGKVPARVAFIQCAGSRDVQCESPYCSAVCCMSAVKEAQITKEHLPGARNIDIYYMDMRAYGKDFDRYVNSARDKYGVNFIRGRAGGVKRDETTGELLLSYCEESGGMAAGRYDMVVLSVGVKPGPENRDLFAGLGVKTDMHGFVWTDEFTAPSTSRMGVFACGAAVGPKDIPHTVIEASASAGEAAKFANMADVDLYGDYGAFFTQEPEVQERDVSKEPIRIGVFVCHCGANIGGYLTVKDVVGHARALPFVSFADESMYTCSVDAQKIIGERIREFGLNRVVVASCTPRTHEPLFQNVVKKAGLNPYLFAMANIRDQCSWVHMEEREAATEKAKELVSMAVARVTHARSLSRKKIPVERSALVIGGGIAGMAAALELGGMGYRVRLVERSARLGGSALDLASDRYGRPIRPYVGGMIRAVQDNGRIKTHTSSVVDAIEGYVGNFRTILATPDGPAEFEHGVVIVAAGAREASPNGFAIGGRSKITTHLDFERRLKDPAAALDGIRSVVMIQCVGSRDELRPYCSRVCCNQALRNAALVKRIAPGTDVTILYREIRSYGTNEELYSSARALGVRFVRFNDDEYPTVTETDDLVVVTARDAAMGVELTFEASILSLAAAIQPDVSENRRIARMLKIPLNQDGFFMEAHAKLRPVDFATEGVYLAGLAHSPGGLRESLIQGRAAAARAATILSREQIEAEGAIARVDWNLCSACGACEQVCAYNAVSVEDVLIRRSSVKKAVVNDILCKGCGTCSSACRCGAIDVNGFSDAQVISEIEYLLRGAPIW
ncbi:MAG: FAD-dependent oxidoreductase [Synergistaceae bacterium]|jgi:heterodisulfide reductase subunit A-like polyferredoxin|nr:FAD-dependent oxidoreductase [Synergistaceae bacterium]